MCKEDRVGDGEDRSWGYEGMEGKTSDELKLRSLESTLLSVRVALASALVMPRPSEGAKA